MALPGLLLTVAAMRLLQQNRSHVSVQRALLAMRYAAVALLASSALKLIPSEIPLRSARSIGGLCMVAAVFAAVQFFKLSPALGVVLAVAIGVVIL
jgi:chromate transport protein ChrA